MMKKSISYKIKSRGVPINKKISNFFDNSFKYWALLPIILVLIFLTLYPTIQMVRMGFSEVSFHGNKSIWSFVGLKHLKTAISDPVVPVAFRNTFIFVIIFTSIETLLALLLAIAVSRIERLSKFYRTIIMIPLLIPPIATGTMWRLMYNYNYGFINEILATFGIKGPTWLANPHLAFPSVIIVDVWQWTSFLFLIILAGLESIPKELGEAARIDGATERQYYRYIVFPLLKPTIITAIILRSIFAFKVFDEIYVLTGGGPGITTQVVSLYVFQVYFSQFRFGYGAFLTILAIIPISIILIFYQRVKTNI